MLIADYRLYTATVVKSMIIVLCDNLILKNYVSDIIMPIIVHELFPIVIFSYKIAINLLNRIA